MKIIKIELYKTEVLFFEEKDPSKAEKTILKYKNEKHDLSDCDGLCVASGIDFPLIWVQKKSILTIIHESIHAAMNILESRGIKISQDNDEPLTYLVEYIVENILKK